MLSSNMWKINALRCFYDGVTRVSKRLLQICFGHKFDLCPFEHALWLGFQLWHGR